MAITRSQIARQLLAEGGAPRIPFRNGGGRTDADTMSGSGYGAGSSSSNDGYGGGDDVARQTYAEQYKTENPMMQPGTTGDTFPGLSKVTPRDVFSSHLKRTPSNERIILAAIDKGAFYNYPES